MLRVGETSGDVTELMMTLKSLIESLPLLGSVLLGFQFVAVLQLELEAPTHVEVCVAPITREVQSTRAIAETIAVAATRRRFREAAEFFESLEDRPSERPVYGALIFPFLFANYPE
jgi:hypothetical protein